MSLTKRDMSDSHNHRNNPVFYICMMLDLPTFTATHASVDSVPFDQYQIIL